MVQYFWHQIQPCFVPMPELCRYRATVTEFCVSPVSARSRAESDAKNTEPLSTTVTCPAFAAWFDWRTVEADGLDVVMVSETLLSEAALA